jgi:hypothetical protein
VREPYLLRTLWKIKIKRLTLQDPGNNFEKEAQQKQAEPTQKTTKDPRSATALHRKRQENRDEPEQQGDLQDHWGGLYISFQQSVFGDQQKLNRNGRKGR